MSKRLAMCAADVFGIFGYVDDEYPGANHILHGGACNLESRLNVGQDLFGLLVCAADPYEFSTIRMKGSSP